MEEIFTISQLMTQLNNMTKLEKYQHEKVMIIQLVVYYILLILKKNYRLIAVDLSKQKALDAVQEQFKKLFLQEKQKH